MRSLVEQHSVRRLSKHDNKTLHVKCYFSTLFFLYLLKVTRAPVKWPMLFHYYFNQNIFTIVSILIDEFRVNFAPDMSPGL